MDSTAFSRDLSSNLKHLKPPKRRVSDLIKQLECEDIRDQTPDNPDDRFTGEQTKAMRQEHNESRLEQANGKSCQSSSVLGIFHRVWSFVKVAKKGHHQERMRRQNSEDASQYIEYIPGEQLRTQGRHKLGRTNVMLNQKTSPEVGLSSQSILEMPIRRSGSQPAPSGNSGLAEESQQISPLAYMRRQALAAYYSRKAADNPYHPTTFNVEAESEQGEQRKPWGSRLRRSVTSVNASGSPKYRDNQFQPLNSARTSLRQVVHLPKTATFDNADYSNIRDRLPDDESLSDEDDHERESNDIYSTPNDSIQSIPSTAPVFTTDRNEGDLLAARLRQSFSYSAGECLPVQLLTSQPPTTKNLSSQLITKQDFLSPTDTSMAQMSEFKRNERKTDSRSLSGSREEIKENEANFQHHNSNEHQAKKLQARTQNSNLTQNNTRFFISTSSSEDSNCPTNQQRPEFQTKNNHQQILSEQQVDSISQEQVQFHIENYTPQVSLNGSVHYHESRMSLGASAHRPHNLSIGPDFNRPPNLRYDYIDLSVNPVIGPTDVNRIVGVNHPINFNVHRLATSNGYKKSPSLFEIANNNRRIQSSAIPNQTLNIQASGNRSSHETDDITNGDRLVEVVPNYDMRIPNSISLQDCKLEDQLLDNAIDQPKTHRDIDNLKVNDNGEQKISEYQLIKMLLESGTNPNNKDKDGNTALMHAIISDNLPAIKCLIEHNADLNITNSSDQNALDILCSREPTESRLLIFKFLLRSQVDLDRVRDSDNSRLLDRLIWEHSISSNKLPYIEYLLQQGAKLGASTWLAAEGKFEIHLRLLRKLCQDGYFLYKKPSIEAAVYRFEFALKMLAVLEQQLAHPGFVSWSPEFMASGANPSNYLLINKSEPVIRLLARQIKYQAYLGLSRCERQRRFYKRALEFAQLAILVNSTSYEGFYSKAQILKDIGDIDDSLMAIDQTSRLVDKSIESLQFQLNKLQHNQREAFILDRCFNGAGLMSPSEFESGAELNFAIWNNPRLEMNNNNNRPNSKSDLINNLEYMREAKRHIAKLRAEIMGLKLKGVSSGGSFSANVNLVAT